MAIKINLAELLDYLQHNPHEAERMNQCFNCQNLTQCDYENCEDENGMCQKYVPLAKRRSGNE